MGPLPRGRPDEPLHQNYAMAILAHTKAMFERHYVGAVQARLSAPPPADPHVRRVLVVTMTLLTTARPLWHCRAYTASQIIVIWTMISSIPLLPKSACFFSVARGCRRPCCAPLPLDLEPTGTCTRRMEPEADSNLEAPRRVIYTGGDSIRRAGGE